MPPAGAVRVWEGVPYGAPLLYEDRVFDWEGVGTGAEGRETGAPHCAQKQSESRREFPHWTQNMGINSFGEIDRYMDSSPF